MATYGAKYIRWAPFASTDPEPADALPNYGTPMSLGALQKVTDTPSFNETKAYGDDVLKEHVVEFKESVVDVEILELENEVAAAIFGSTISAESGSEDDLIENTADNAPYGGLGFVSCKIINNVKVYKGVFYPKLKATMQADEYATKGESITLNGGKLRFTAAACNTGQWRCKSGKLSTEAAAKAWVDAKIAAAAG